MTTHIGLSASSRLVHTFAYTPANVNSLNMASVLLHSEEQAAFGDAGYQGGAQEPGDAGPTGHVDMCPRLWQKLKATLNKPAISTLRLADV